MTPPPPSRLAEADLLLRASRAVGRIDAQGERGATLCSVDEIEAMAVLLAIAGLPALPPGTEPQPGHYDRFVRIIRGADR